MERERIDAYFDRPEVRAELIAAISRLVAVKSVRGEPGPDAPFGPGPRAALDEALTLCAGMGFRAANYDNYVGTVDLNDGETALHILGHLDVVGEGSGWDTDPYTCVERDGLLFGRGVSDDKGPVCAALMAMKAVRELGGVGKNVRLILGTDEESGSGDIAYYYAREPFAPYAFTPDADFPLINIEKGHYHPTFGAKWEPESCGHRVASFSGGFRLNVVPPEAQCEVLGFSPVGLAKLCKAAAEDTGARFELIQTERGCTILCHGKNAHAAGPGAGINAIQALLELLFQLPLDDCPSTRAIRAMQHLFPFGDWRGEGLGIAQADEESGELTLNLALMELGDTGFWAKFDSRTPLCANRRNCKKVCETAFRNFGIDVLEDPGMIPPHHVPGDSELVRKLLKCYQMFTGDADAKPIAIGGGTYVHDIPGGVAFGCDFPGFDPRMHAANEQASVDNLLLSAKIFTQAIFELCGE